MANEQKGEVGLEVKGKRYTLKPTFNSLCELEELTGKTFSDIATKAAKGGVSAVRQLVWAYLQEYHSGEIKTLKDAGKWISDSGGLMRVDEALRKLNTLNAEDSEPSEGNPPEAVVGIGERSTSKPDAAA